MYTLINIAILIIFLSTDGKPLHINMPHCSLYLVLLQNILQSIIDEGDQIFEKLKAFILELKNNLE